MDINKPLEISENYTITVFWHPLAPPNIRDVVLFGANKNLFLPNFGNPSGMLVTCSSTVDYGQLLAQSLGQPFEIAQWKIITENQTLLQEQIRVHYYDANRRDANDPIDINKDVYQFSEDSVVFWYPIKIDGNTEFRIRMQRDSLLKIKIYPSTIAIPSRPLIGKSEQKNLRVPKIAGFMGTQPQGKEFLNGDVLSADGTKRLLVPKIAGFQSMGNEFVNR